MKRFIALVSAVVVGVTTLAAQNYMVVDSKKIFESYPAYTSAMEALNKEAQSYQAQVDARFKIVETEYNNYMKVRATMSAAQQKQREGVIQRLEDEATEYQESIFGEEGTLVQRQQNILEPIQKSVMSKIDSYAKSNGFDLVLDSATSPSILYRSEKVERTSEVIKLLK